MRSDTFKRRLGYYFTVTIFDLKTIYTNVKTKALE